MKRTSFVLPSGKSSPLIFYALLLSTLGFLIFMIISSNFQSTDNIITHNCRKVIFKFDLNFQIVSSRNKVKKQGNIISEQLLKIWDSTEIKKDKWRDYICKHPFYLREGLSYTDWKSIPKTDRPDLATELDFLKRVDPEIGIIPTERLHSVASMLKSTFQNKSSIAGVNWEERGPDNFGGRTRAILFDPNDPQNKKVWAGGVGGGLWYSDDITLSNPVWHSVNDFWDNIAITTIAYNPLNTQELYVGTGENWGNADSQRGAGIWKSNDGGVTWVQLVSTNPGAYDSGSDFQWIQKIVIKPNGVIFAATQGYYSNSGGILRSIDGGITWLKVKSNYVPSTGLKDDCADIEVSANGDVYCSFGIGSQAKVYKSVNADNGDIGTWTDLSNALAIGGATRIELACAPSNSSVIYAVADGGLGDTDVLWFKKSINSGISWTNVSVPLMVDGSGNHFTRGQAWYDLILAVHPLNENIVLAGGVDLHRSLDGGGTWTGISHWYGGFSKPEVHADQHNILFRPSNSNCVLVSNDGGIVYSHNAGDALQIPTFLDVDNGYNTVQFYSCAMKNEFNSHYFLAGAQDNGSHKFSDPQINSTVEVSGGDGAFCHIDQQNANIQTTAYVYNSIYRSIDNGTSFNPLINETTGFFINPSEYDSDRKILYSASSNNQLKRISNMDGSVLNIDISLALGGAKISALKICPFSDDLIIGVSNGRVYKLENASSASYVLTRIDNGPNPITSVGWVSSIDIGANINQVLVTYSNYGVTSIWETVDGGLTWNNKEGNLPDIPVNWALYNPENRNEVLIATDLGVWSSDNFQPGSNLSPSWGQSSNGLAFVRCEMLKYRSSDRLVAVATHGRGLFTSDIFSISSAADFEYDQSYSCSGPLTVKFKDASLKANNSWEWDIDNDGTIDYYTRNPVHTYNSPGMYSVSLKINNGITSITKNNLIYVASGDPVYSGCSIASNSNSGNAFGIGITNFKLNEIEKTTSNNDGSYTNLACTNFSILSLNTQYSLTIKTGTTNNEGARVYIDYNSDGDFLDANEMIASFPSNNIGLRTTVFTTPANGVILNMGLRVRVISKYNSVPSNPCDVGAYGQAEDYLVYFPSYYSLPVELVSFNANCLENGSIDVSWVTATEHNASHYVVDKSVEGTTWATIATVQAAGNSTTTLNYSLNDEERKAGDVYYRLTQYDVDGKNKVYDPISIDCSIDITKSTIVTYPNPSSNSFYVELNAVNAEGFAILSIIDVHGSVVSSRSIEVKKGLTVISVDDLTVSPGMYYISVQSENDKFELVKHIVK